MGSLCSNLKQRKQDNREELVRNTSRSRQLPQPVITTDNEVMIIDFTRESFGATSITSLKEKFPNYIPVDFRCYRERPILSENEKLGDFAHSYVDVLGRKPGSPLDELSLCVDFVEDGIEVCLGQLSHIQSYKNRKSPLTEEFFFAEADTTCTRGFHEILDWVDQHRYKHLKPLGLDDEERNLGRQLYVFIRSFYHCELTNSVQVAGSHSSPLESLLMATKRPHQRSLSDIKKTPKTPYLPDSAVRVPTQLALTRVNVCSPTKRACSVLLNDSGSAMFHAVQQRKETQRQLLVMENRIKALQKAESDARRKLETAKRLMREKSEFWEVKQKQVEEKREWREEVKRQRKNTHSQVEDARQARRERLQQAKDRALESRCTKAQSVKQDLQQRFSSMRSFLTEDLQRKSQMRLNITEEYKGARSQVEESERAQRKRKAGLFQEKMEAERKQHLDMQQRIKQLEEVETRLTEHLKQTLSYHEQEVWKLDQLVRSSTESL